MDSVRSSSPLFSGSGRVELPSVAQGNLISSDPEEESRDRANVIQDKLASTSRDSIPCAQGLPAQTMPDSFSQGIRTSLVMDASPVQHIQDVYGNPSCDGDFTRNGVRKKGPFWKKEKSVDFRTEDCTQPEFSQYSRYSQPTDNTRNKSDIEETSVWRPFVVRESNTGYIDPQLDRRSVVSEEGTRLANFRHRPCISPPGRSVEIDRGYGDSARVGDAFVPCRDRFYPSRQDNPVYRSSGDVSGYHRGFGGTSYVVEDPSLDPCTIFERQGPGPQLVGLDPRPNYNVDSSVSAGMGYNPPVQAQQNTGLTSSPYQIDTEVNASDKSPRRKQKEPDKYDGEKIEWQDFQVHFETVAAWNGWTNTEKGLQLSTSLRGKAQKVLSELKPSQKSDYQTLSNVLGKRFSPPHRESAFRAVLRQRPRLPKESLMDYGCEVSRIAQKAYPEFPYEALDQVSREQFVRGLSDIDMKRHVDLRNPSSLEEPISLATQFESFDLGEGHNLSTGRGITRPHRGRTAPVQAEEQQGNKLKKDSSEELANIRKQIEILLARESKAEKDSKIVSELDQKISKLTEQVESLAKLGSARTEHSLDWRNRPSRFRNQNNSRSDRLPRGNCFGCGQPGHYKNACPKIKKAPNKPKNEEQEINLSGARRLVVQRGGWLVPGVVEGVKVEMLVDS